MTLASAGTFARTRPLSTIVAGAVLGSLLGVVLAAIAPGSSRVSIAFTIAEQQRQETADYSYDGYYSIRAAELVADSLMSWLATPSVIKDIHTAAGLPITDAQAFAKAGRAFRAKKLSSQNVVVTFNAPDRAAATKLARETGKTLSAKAAQLVLTSKSQPQFLVSAGSPVIADGRVRSSAAAAAGLLIGAFLGFVAAYRARRPDAE